MRNLSRSDHLLYILNIYYVVVFLSTYIHIYLCCTFVPKHVTYFFFIFSKKVPASACPGKTDGVLLYISKKKNFIIISLGIRQCNIRARVKANVKRFFADHLKYISLSLCLSLACCRFVILILPKWNKWNQKFETEGFTKIYANTASSPPNSVLYTTRA